MTPAADQFYECLPDEAKETQSTLISFFIYFITVEENEEFATSSAIKKCFDDCDLPAPKNISARLREGASGSKPKYISKGVGYRLNRQLRNQISFNLHASGPTKKIHKSLRTLGEKFAEGEEKRFLLETISCFEIGATRAAVIMCWLLTLDHLQKYILTNKLGEFNLALAKNTDKRVSVSAVATQEDFSEMPESKFIEFCRSSKIISKDVRRILDEKLHTRNSSAHPSGIVIKETKVVDFIEDLVENVLLKFEI